MVKQEQPQHGAADVPGDISFDQAVNLGADAPPTERVDRSIPDEAGATVEQTVPTPETPEDPHVRTLPDGHVVRMAELRGMEGFSHGKFLQRIGWGVSELGGDSYVTARAILALEEIDGMEVKPVQNEGTLKARIAQFTQKAQGVLGMMYNELNQPDAETQKTFR